MIHTVAVGRQIGGVPGGSGSLFDDWVTLEALVDSTPDIDRWCSGPDWLLPVYSAFAQNAEPVILGSPEEGGFGLLARYANEHDEPMLAGMEPLWGFSCPVLTADPASFAPRLAELLARTTDWQYLVMPGMPASGPLTTAVAHALQPLGRVGGQDGIVRQVLDLNGDAHCWLGRRSARFRRQMRRLTRDAQEAGIGYEDITESDGLLDRLVAIEMRGWKGLEANGITSPEMRRFYTEMVARLGPRKRLRATIATQNGEDVAFILGGIRGSMYRGLQLSYVESVRDLSLGHVLQHREIHALARLGVSTYDMGMDMEYKQRFADRSVQSMTLILIRE